MESEQKTMKSRWHYLPVYEENIDRDGVKHVDYSICEVYLDDSGLIDYWNAKPSLQRCGDSVEELVDRLELMLADTRKWEPVEYESLVSGMKLKKASHIQ